MCVTYYKVSAELSLTFQVIHRGIELAITVHNSAAGHAYVRWIATIMYTCILMAVP